MGKQVTTREVLQKLKKSGFIKSLQKGKGSHQRYIKMTQQDLQTLV